MTTDSYYTKFSLYLLTQGILEKIDKADRERILLGCKGHLAA